MTRVLLAVLLGCGAGAETGERAVTETTSAMESESAMSETTTAMASETMASAAAEPTRRRLGEVATTSEHPAVNAVVFGSRIVIHEPTDEGRPLRLTARDLFDDQVLWSIERTREGFNGFIQRFDDEHLLLSLGDRLERISVSDGRVLDSHAYSGFGRFIWADRGVCLLNERCSFDVLDCETARPLQRFQIGRSLRRPLHREGHSHTHGETCMGGPTIIGRSGDVLILHVDNWETNRLTGGQRMRTGAAAWVGVSATSGDILWDAQHAEERTHGVGGSYAWFRDDSGITVLHARNGRVHRRIARTNVRFVFDLRREPAAIQLHFGDSVEVVDLQHGRVVERRAIAEGALAVYADAIYPQHFYMQLGSDEPQSFSWIAPGVDPVVTTIPAGQTLHRGPEGQPWVVAGSPSYDSAGNLVQRSELVVDRYRSGDAGPPDRARLKDGERVIAEFDHDAWAIGSADHQATHAVALFVQGDDWRTDGRVYIHRARR